MVGPGRGHAITQDQIKRPDRLAAIVPLLAAVSLMRQRLPAERTHNKPRFSIMFNCMIRLAHMSSVA